MKAAQEVKTIKFGDSMEEIEALVKSAVPIIWVQTHEEIRFIEDFVNRVTTPSKRKTWVWSAWQGLVEIKDVSNLPCGRASGAEDGTWNIGKALDRICSLPVSKPEDSNFRGTVFILKDLHFALQEPIPRQIRDIYNQLQAEQKILLVVSPMLSHGPGGNSAGLPPTLEKQVSVVRFELPTPQQIQEAIQFNLEKMKEGAAVGANLDTKIDYTKEEIQSFVRAVQGLTMSEISDAIAISVCHLKEIHVELLTSFKKQIIRKSDILEFIEQKVEVADVGGMDRAKEYLSKYIRAYTPEAKEFGMEPLKAVLLTGVPGTGKSLLAKAISNLWHLPLLRLDIGKVMGSLVGQSENRMREAIQSAQAMSPCLLWVDEIEKALSGTKSSNFSDGGTLSRVFGTLLTAMQEGLEGVTLIATANDIAALPPELIRRFNEVFFVDLPSPDERWEVFSIHLRKKNRDVANFVGKKAELLAASENYTGAEIEKAVKDAIAAAFYAGKKDVDVDDLITALNQTKPIFKIMGKKIQELRDKAKGQYRYASSYAEEQSEITTVRTKTGKSLNMNEALDDLDEMTSTPKEKNEKVSGASANRFKRFN